MQWPCSPGRLAGYLFTASLVVHLLVLSQYAASPFFAVPRLDALYNDQLARQFLTGSAPAEPFFRAPGYSGFLAGVYALFGTGPWAPRVVQSVLGAGSVVLTYAIGRRWFGPVAALLGAAAMALYGPLVYNDLELHTPPLEVFLDLLALWLLPRSAGASGLALGLSAIVRPNALLALPVLALWLARRRGSKAAALFALAALLAPAAVTWRNVRVAGDPVFIASQGGINLYLGNRPESDGFTPSTPKRYRVEGPYQDSVAVYGQRAAEEALGRPLRASESGRYWVGQAGRFWRERPGDALALTGRKLLLALNARELRNNTAFAYVRGAWAPLLWLAPVGFGVAGGFGLWGLAVGARGRSPLAGFVVVYLAGIVAFFAADRYRLPIVPILLLFAGHGARVAWERRRPRDFVGIGLCALLVAGPGLTTERPGERAQDEWSAGSRLLALGRVGDAEARMRRAVAEDPGLAEAWSGLGEALFAGGAFRNAAEAFLRAAERSPEDPRGPYNAAQALHEGGHTREAEALLVEALRRDPGYVPARLALAGRAPERVAPGLPGARDR